MKKIVLPLLLAAFGAGMMNAEVKIGDTTYNTLNDAVTAATDGDVIEITGVTEIDSRVNINKGITIQGADADAQIKRKWGKNFAIMLNFQPGSETAVVKDLTVSGSTVNVGGTTVEVNYDCRNNSSYATLQNVKFIECTNTNNNNQGIICVKGNGRLVLDGVSIIDANTPNFTVKGDVFCGNNDDVILRGNNDITVNLEGRINADGELTNSAPIVLNVIKNINIGGLIVKGCHDVSKFEVCGAENTRLTDGRDGLMYSSFIPVMENAETHVKYTSLAEALASVAEGENYFDILADVTSDARYIPGAGKSVSFTGKDGMKTITRGNFNNGNSTFEMNGQSNGTMSFTNIHFVNTNTGVTNAMLVAQGGQIVLNNVTEAFETNTSWNLQIKTNGHASATDAQLRKVMVNAKGHLTLNGNNDMNITLQDGSSELLVAEGGALTNGKAIRLTYQTLPEVGAVVVKNCKDAGKFYLTNAGYSLVADGENLVLADAPEVPVLTVNGAEVTSTQLKEGDVVSVTAPAGYTVWYRITDAEPAAALLAAGQLAGYTDSGENAMTYTVEKGKVVSFICANADQSKESEPYTFTIAADGTVTGIEAVETEEAENAPVEWYTMQGVRVAEPADGLFIKKQGDKVTKVIVK